MDIERLDSQVYFSPAKLKRDFWQALAVSANPVTKHLVYV